MTKIFCFICFLSTVVNITAGDFEWKAAVDSVPKDGFYKILILPDILWATKPDYSDIRIFDAKHQEIPYIFLETYDIQMTTGQYSEVPGPVISQVDSPKTKKSYIKLMFAHPYEIGKLELQVEGPDLYFRNCLLGIYTQKRSKQIFEGIGCFNISSKSKPVWKFDDIRTNQLNIVIENLDNTPLLIKQVKAYQHNKYLAVKLSPNKKYNVVYGQKDIARPEYDLKYFADSIAPDIPVIKTGKPLKINMSAPPVPFIFNKTILWIIIGAVILLLGGFTIRLAGEIGKRR